MENEILLIYLLKYRIHIGHFNLLTVHYIHIPCDIDYVHSHVEGMKSDISGFVAHHHHHHLRVVISLLTFFMEEPLPAQVFLNEEPQLMPRKCQIDAFSTIYTPKSK